jgi:signal transduction histidine kinase
VLQQLQSYRSAIPLAEVRPHTLRGLSRKIIEIFTRLGKQHLPKEQTRHIINEAIQLERLVCIATLRQVETELMAMDHQVRAFREHITTSARFEEAPQVIRFWDLVKQAMSNLGEYARCEGVEFRAKDESHNAHVLIGSRDMLRAVSNLLHNAIKYSWAREKGTPPWIVIHAFVQADSVYVMFENYGVPIPEDEIKQGLIFQFGYRGRLSSDRGRLGTGIGLTDARKTARHFGGDVVVESTCAWRGSAPNDYKAPYLTRVTLSLPLHSLKGDW